MLELERCALKNLSINSRDYEPGEPLGEIELGYNFGFEVAQVSHDPPGLLWIPVRLVMRFTMSDGPFASVAFVVEGNFSLPDQAPAEAVGDALIINMLIVLYGSARGMVASASGVFFGGPYWVPTFDMQAAYEDFCNDHPQPREALNMLRARFQAMKDNKMPATAKKSAVKSAAPTAPAKPSAKPIGRPAAKAASKPTPKRSAAPKPRNPNR